MDKSILDKMSETDRLKALELMQELSTRKQREASKQDFLKFVQSMWPEFIHGDHHAKMARAFERVVSGKLKRLIINMPPRHTKSEFASYMLPAWFLGLNPHKQVMQISHTADMAEGFGRKVRNLVDSDVYHSVFPETRLRRDSTAAARWNTDKNGVYIAMGVGGAVAGKGADLLIIDDPISEQEGKGLDPAPFDNVYDYYMTGPRQRLQPGGAIIVVMTRWNKRDLTGRLIDNMVKNPNGDQWEVIEFPAILPSGKPLWPEFWPLEELEKTRISVDNRFWQAQYQQNPTSEEGAIVKREWWQRWDKEDPPSLTYTLLSWDTAFEKHNRADYSALTVWGIFYQDDDDGNPRQNIILLDAVKKRVEFPELKEWAYTAYKDWEPDSMIIEKRASGASLIQELRRDRKSTRLNSSH